MKNPVNTELPKLVMATNNAHKLSEIRQILDGQYVILSLKDIGCETDIPETGLTLEENACQKAGFIKEHFGYDCFADDTGLEVEALDGEPGVRTARFAGEDCNPDNNMALLLERLNGKDNRKARFRTVIAIAQGKQMHTVEGIVNGEIAMEKASDGLGFGYDPVFIPQGHTVTFAQMPSEDKHAISHRGRAVVKLVEFLESSK